MQNPSKLIILLIISLITTTIQANNLTIDNISRSGSQITFDVEWENSWRSGLSYHDAVWIFLKQAPNGGASWNHVNIIVASTTGSFQAVLPSDQVGIFVRRTSNGNGTSSTTVTATVSGLTGAYQDIKVMGIEMVYIPQAAFYAGDGVSTSRIARGDDATEAIHITSENTLTCGSSTTQIQYPPSSGCEDIPAAFPKGYAPVYSMKYAITQEQYVDFLNCLPRNSQENRVESDISGSTVANVFVMSDNAFAANFNGIRCDENIGTGPINFYCDANNNDVANEAADGQTRACNFLNVEDWYAYLDWSGLRPMSFLEYEKIARGTILPVPGEYSWGTTDFNSNSSFSRENSGTASEQWSGSGITPGISTYDGDPIRVGANAQATGATRALSNASFYGVIDLGNNPSDWILDKTHVSVFTGENGDGVLSTIGEANTIGWPSLDAAMSNKIKLPISSSGQVSSHSMSSTGRSRNSGGRGVRSF